MRVHREDSPHALEPACTSDFFRRRGHLGQLPELRNGESLDFLPQLRVSNGASATVKPAAVENRTATRMVERRRAARRAACAGSSAVVLSVGRRRLVEKPNQVGAGGTRDPIQAHQERRLPVGGIYSHCCRPISTIHPGISRPVIVYHPAVLQGSLGRGRLRKDAAYYFLPCFFSTLAQASFRATVRSNTNFPAVESGSTQKYPSRSN